MKATDLEAGAQTGWKSCWNNFLKFLFETFSGFSAVVFSRRHFFHGSHVWLSLLAQKLEL